MTFYMVLPFETEAIQMGNMLITPPGGVVNSGYIVMLRARMFRSLIIRTGIKERNICARNITI